MATILEEDDQAVTFMTPQGPVRVARPAAMPYMPTPEPALEPEPVLEAAPAPAPAALPDVLEQDEQSVTFGGPNGPVRVARQYATPFLPSATEPAADAGRFDGWKDLAKVQHDAAAPAKATGQPASSPAVVSAVTPQAAPTAEPGIEVDAISGAGAAVPTSAPADAAGKKSVSLMPAALPEGPLDLAKQTVRLMEEEAGIRAESAEAVAQGYEQVAGAYEQGEAELDSLTLKRQRYEAARTKLQTGLQEGITRDVQKLSNWKVDRGRFWHDRSTANKVGLWISIALSGLGSAMKGEGDKNTALDMILGMAQEDVQLQMAERDRLGSSIDQRRGSIVDLMQTTKDRLAYFNAETAGRIARVARELEEIGARSSAQSVRDNAKLNANQLNQAATGLIGKAALQEADARLQAEERRQRAAAAAAAAAAKKAEDRARFEVVQNVRYNPKTGGYDRLPPTEEQQLATAQARATLTKTQGEAAGATGGPGGNPYAIGDAEGNPYKNKGGDVFTVKDDTRRLRINELNVAAHNITRMADLVQIMKDDKGGASKTVGSPEYQELQSLAAQVDFETFKAFGLGAPSEGDRELSEAARGGKDITSFVYNAAPGFQAFAKGVQQKLNAEMRSAGYTGPTVKPPRLDLARSRELTTEENAARIAEPVPTGAKGDTPEAEALRGKVVSRKKAALNAELRKKPSIETLSTWAGAVEQARTDGELTTEDAHEIVNQAAPLVLRQWREKVQRMPKEKLKEMQNDPTFLRRVRLLGLLDAGMTRPDEVYRLVVGL